MKHIVLPIVFAFLLVTGGDCFGARPPGGGAPCGGEGQPACPPNNYEKCYDAEQNEVLCPSASSGSGSGFDATTILIAAGVGVVFVGAMWYLFHTPQSDNFKGQVKLASF